MMSMEASKMEPLIAAGGNDWNMLIDKTVKIQLISEQIPDWLKKAKDPHVLLIEQPSLQPLFSGR
jgi:hypothetical protein